MTLLVILLLVAVAGVVAWYTLDRDATTPEQNPNWPFPHNRP
jgi:hypothetical protein